MNGLFYEVSATHTLLVLTSEQMGVGYLAQGHLSSGNDGREPGAAFPRATPIVFIPLAQTFSHKPASLTSRPLLPQFNAI